jgi:hypothetical protein
MVLKRNLSKEAFTQKLFSSLSAFHLFIQQRHPYRCFSYLIQEPRHTAKLNEANGLLLSFYHNPWHMKDQ